MLRRVMHAERYCLYCNELLGKDWARSDQKYCDSSCRASYRYRKLYKPYYDAKYQRLKKQWERSPNGKRAGVAIRNWLKLPEDWR